MVPVLKFVALIKTSVLLISVSVYLFSGKLPDNTTPEFVMEKATIYRVLNETATILIRSTLLPDQTFPEGIRKEFSKITIFYAAMMNAISNTINPATQQFFSIYNYHAIESILMRSGCFIKESDDTLEFKTHKTPERTINLLNYQLFGITFDHKGAQAVNTIFKNISREALRMMAANNPEQYKAGHIIFIVEYIDGIKKVLVKSIYINRNEHKKRLKRALFKSWHLSMWKIHTESFLYISNTMK